MAMIFDCPNCATRYQIAAAIPPEGRKARCAKCGYVWTIYGAPPEEEDDDIVFREEDESGESAPTADPLQADNRPEPIAERDAATAEAPRAEIDDVEEAEEAARDLAGWQGAAYEDEREAWPAPDDEAEPGPAAEPEAAFADLDEDVAPEPDIAGQDELGGDEDFYSDLEQEDIRPVLMRHPRRRRKPAAGAGLGWTALAVMLLAGFALAYLQRVEIVRAVPGMAELYGSLGVPVNARGLEFEDVRSDWTAEDGRLYLEVRGGVANISADAVRVPTVVFMFHDDDNSEILRWAADIRSEPLPAGERARFVARIPAPAHSAGSLRVRFSGDH